MGHRIKYIAFYDVSSNAMENRHFLLSAKNKIDYICTVLASLGCSVEILSPSWTNNKKGFYKGNSTTIKDNVNLRLFSTFGASTRLFKFVKYIWSLWQLLVYLLINTRKSEMVIAYHSPILIDVLRFVKYIKKIRLLLEVEEIYSDILQNEKLKTKEYNLYQVADMFLLSTNLLNEKINRNNKPNAVIFGTYQVEKNRNCKINDGKIHVVYAGTFNPTKGGAASVKAAMYLPVNYHVHIIGFGNEKETYSMKTLIDNISQRAKCTISYDGLLRDEEYIRFVQSCDIGLSTQLPDATYNDTSFPSKILSYMANGLHVVSVRIRAIEISKIGGKVIYFDEHKPEEIAKAIMKVDLSKTSNSRDWIRSLDEDFREDLYKLLGS